jgi:hypothetical protein
MANAKLIKTLEKKGFSLEFPEYDSNEELIIEILKEDNQRILVSLPIILMEKFDYQKIVKKLNNTQKKELNKIILISEKIYNKENILNELRIIINENKIKTDFSKEEFNSFHEAFKEAQISLEKDNQKLIERQSKLRLNLDLNKSLKVLFAPAKIRIMEKIFNHEKLTNTELKYYYRAISSINKAVLNPALQDYLRIIEITRKEREQFY